MVRIKIGIVHQKREPQWYDLDSAEFRALNDPHEGCYWELGGISKELDNVYPWFGKDEPVILEIDGKRYASYASKGAHLLRTNHIIVGGFPGWCDFHGTVLTQVSEIEV